MLVEQPPATHWPLCNACECDLDARPIRAAEGGFVAACPLDFKADVHLDENDIRTFEVDVASLLKEIRTASLFRGLMVEVQRGVWLLGEIAERHTVFITLLNSTIEDPTLPRVLHGAAAGSRLTLLGPRASDSIRTRFADAQIHYVTLIDAVTEGVFRLDFSQLLPAPSKPRFVLERGSRRARLDGRGTVLTHRAFEMAMLLVNAVLDGSTVVSHERIEKSLFSGQSDDRFPAADAIRDLRDQIRPLLQKGAEIKELIQNRPARGYMLNLRASEVLVRS